GFDLRKCDLFFEHTGLFDASTTLNPQVRVEVPTIAGMADVARVRPIGKSLELVGIGSPIWITSVAVDVFTHHSKVLHGPRREGLPTTSNAALRGRCEEVAGAR